jgi:hypothetical protein
MVKLVLKENVVPLASKVSVAIVETLVLLV